MKDFSPTEKPYRYSIPISAAAKISKVLDKALGVLGVAKEMISLTFTENSFPFKISRALSGSETIIRRMPNSEVSATLQAETLMLAAPKTSNTSCSQIGRAHV